MNQQDQIKRLEESNKELQRQIELQAKQIEEMKSASASDERFEPYQGGGYSILKRPTCLEHEVVSISPADPGYWRKDYYAYQTREQTEWENKATQVRRKLQRICAVLGPAKVGKDAIGATVFYGVRFTRFADAQKAEQILGYDLRYLDWNNSPEARDAREGRI